MMRQVTDDEFTTAVAQWAPKLYRFAKNYFPYLDWEDKLQEGRIVLLNCLRKYDDGKKVSFHTYFHQALVNRAGILGSGKHSRVLKENPIYGREDLNKRIYLSEIQGELDNDRFAGRGDLLALSCEDSSELLLEIESLGFEGLEIVFMAGKSHSIYLAETAELYNVDVDELRKAALSAKIKINRLRGERHHDDQDRLQGDGSVLRAAAG